MDSSVVTDVSKSNRKLDLMVLDQEQDDFVCLPLYMKLLDRSRKRDAKLHNLKFDIELNEKRSQGYYALRSQKKGYKVKKDPVEECFVPLSEEEEGEVTRGLHNSNSSKQYYLLRAWLDFGNLDAVKWYEFYQTLISLSPGVDSQVLDKLEDLARYYVDEVKDKTGKDIDVSSWKQEFVKDLPNQENGHATPSLTKLSPREDEMIIDAGNIGEVKWYEFYQTLISLSPGVDSQVLDKLEDLARYYVDEVKDKTGKDIDVSSWKQEFVKDLPNQENGHATPSLTKLSPREDEMIIDAGNIGEVKWYEFYQTLISLSPGVDSQVLDKLEDLARYYVDEVKDKTGKDIDVSSWKQEFVKDLPNQENGYYVDEVKDKTGKDIDVSSWKQEFVKDLPNQENGEDNFQLVDPVCREVPKDLAKFPNRIELGKLRCGQDPNKKEHSI
ncbi:hypothetical protein RD792_005536 [Penstemon davidsonii]|uniref:Uncharacterized protein n=1 Tax=Penstemon davidsonii TaxID=160366 RepID=A0ABR0DFR1_9LAMI|nr:hypothetical protein RD792_005536 [Penstemon davidsonii]